ncbi:flippase [Natrinema halophilum]|uniref:Flippase n=1 Tax=Natrinema halophilum TaxID=1699371 RepID=A0A7D5GH65_9EURY|nr:flippase [Natrinema halophilum]QLG48828.1 flippase [Natrinema halophilum]
MPVTERILEGFKATLGARLVTNVANGVLMLLLARFLLTPDEYGLFFFVIAVLGVAGMVTDLGSARSAARYVSEYKETDEGRVPYILRTSLGYRLILIAIVASTMIVGHEQVAALLNTPEAAPLLLIGGGYLVFQSLNSYGQTLFQGFNRVELSAIVNVANNVTRVGFVVALTVLGLGVVGAMLGYLVGAAFAAIIALILLYRRFYTTYEDDGGEKSLRNRMFRYSIPLTASTSANIIDKRIDTVLVGFFLNPLAVSYYVLSKQITEFVLVPAGSLGFSVSPTYGEQKANGALEEAARIYESTLQYILLLYIPAAVGLILVADPAVRLVFGADYAGAVPVLQLMAIYVVFQAITNVTTNSLDYLGRASDRAMAKGFTAAANAGLNVLLIPRFGVPGAAFATVVTYGIYTTVNVVVMYREIAFDYVRIGRSVALISAISASMGIAVLFLVPYVSNIVALAGVIGLGVGIWGVLVTLSGLVDPRKTLSMLT